MKKYKVTGFTRFILFLIVMIPLIFVGVGYFKGENPLEEIKEKVSSKLDDRADSKLADYRAEIKSLKEDLAACRNGQ